MSRLVITPSQVLYANAHPSVSHMSAGFAAVFGESIRMTRYVPGLIHTLADIGGFHMYALLIREVVRTTTAQPFLISGSGTLGWDQESAHTLPLPASSGSRVSKHRFQPTSWSQGKALWCSTRDILVTASLIGMPVFSLCVRSTF